MANGTLVLLAALLAGAQPGHGDVVLKVGTLAPAGSAWDDALRDMGRRWEEASGGRVKLKVYPGGTQGDEGDMQRKLSIGQLQAVALTNVGLHDLVPEPQALSAPLLFATEAEVACTLRRVRPLLDEAARARGLVALHWTRLGAASFFCTSPRRTPEDLASAKLFAWEGDPASVKAFRAAGFHPIVLSSTDLLPALSTGMVDCTAQLPLFMLTTRAFERARYEVDLPVSWVLGSTVVKKETWEKIPEDLRDRLLAIADEVGARIDADALRLEADALAAMRTQGLTVLGASPGGWQPALERSWSVLRGEVVPAPFFDAVVAARNACRSAGSAGSR